MNLLITPILLLLPSASFAAVPVADSLAVTTLEDKGKAFTVTGTDADPGSSLAYQVATQPTHGKLIGTGPTFIYVPYLNYHGADSFTFTAHDGQTRSAPATVSITVTPVAEPAATGAAFAEFVDPNPNPGNQFGLTVLALNTGNVVITSPFDDAGGTDAGAVYLFNGATGALISSLRGSKASDQVGGTGVTALSSGNYVVRSKSWDNGTATDAGAVTWGNGSTGVSGVVSDSNSLVGSTAFDQVGSNGVTALVNGNYVVSSPGWNNGAAITGAGAVTWGNGNTGISGMVSGSNSLIGSKAGDGVGISGVTALSNGNYVVRSQTWDNGTVTNAGAATWGNGSTGTSGVVSSSNSLVGSTAVDGVGSSGVTALSNGNYVVRSQTWDNGAATNAGAVTWGNGSTGISGVVSSANSLVGSTTSDQVGSIVYDLGNGNYVVRSQNWDNGAATDAGAVTWGNGSTGISGVISSSNSLVGSTPVDQVGSIVTALGNGNYVMSSPGWDNGATTDAGAVTWGNGSTGISGVVSGSNSLVGSTAFDDVGNVTALSNGNYVVSSPDWDNGAATDAGAATWGNGSTGTSGVVSGSNSLIGSTASDQVGRGVTALGNGNYVVSSESWDNGAATDAGAAIWGNGSNGTSGVVSGSNSLIGSTASDLVGRGVTALGNGNYVVSSANWSNGAVGAAGAATWGNGSTGISGVVSGANSLVGSTAGDGVGAVMTALSNGNYVVSSIGWDNGATTNAGAVTWGNGSTGTSGVVSGANSLLGLSANAFLQAVVVVDEINQTFAGIFIAEGSGKVRVGSQENGGSTLPPITAPTSTAITLTTATLGGHVTAPGAAAIIERGVVYSLTSANADPLISGSGVTKVATTGTTGIFTVPVAGLASGSGYSFKAYATNSLGTSYTAGSTFTTTTAEILFSNSAAAAGLTGDDALPNATPFNDGVENLLKYAFNMNLAGPESSTMAAGGSAGLPAISQSGTGAAGVLRFEFVRRIGSGLAYTPKKNTTLDTAGWTTLTDEPAVTPIGTDDLWERVIYEEPSDPTLVPKCFGRVEVAFP